MKHTYLKETQRMMKMSLRAEGEAIKNRFLAEFTLSRKNEILRSAQNDMRRARNDREGVFSGENKVVL